MAEQDAGRWEEWHYEDEKQGWAVPVVIGTSRPDYPLLHGNREAVLQAVADHRFAAVAREALDDLKTVLNLARDGLPALDHGHAHGPSQMCDMDCMHDYYMRLSIGKVQQLTDALASLTENTGGE